jgi:broad specificity phosphatase PhoE
MTSDDSLVTVLVVRHGQSVSNVSRSLSSAPPGTELTAIGRDQAKKVGRSLAQRPITAIYASTAIRAQQTAAAIATELSSDGGDVRPVNPLPEVREFDLGECEGSDRDEDWALVDAAFDRWLDDDLGHSLPGAESGKDVVERMGAALAEAAVGHSGESIVVVSHGGAMALALPRMASNVPDDRSRGAGIGNCDLVELTFDPATQEWQILTWPTRSSGLGSAAYPGDLGEILGRAAAALIHAPPVGAAGIPAAAVHATVAQVPCVHQPSPLPWTTLAAFTALNYPPRPAMVDAVVEWLDAASPGAWRLLVEADWAGLLAARDGLAEFSQRGVWLCEQAPPLPGFHPDAAAEMATVADVHQLVGPEVAATVALDLPDREFLVLRRAGQLVAGAQLRDVAGTTHVGPVTVVPQLRGQGWGTAISALATRRALQRSPLAWLYCTDELGDFYRRLGYQRVTTHVHLGPSVTVEQGS